MGTPAASLGAMKGTLLIWALMLVSECTTKRWILTEEEIVALLRLVEQQISLLDAEGQILRKHMLKEDTSDEKATASGHVIEKKMVPFSRTLRMRRQQSSPNG